MSLLFAALVTPVTAVALNTTVTVVNTSYFTTYCSTPTTFAYAGSTYTVSEATTLTITDCACTEKPSAVPTTPAASAPGGPKFPATTSVVPPPLANGGERAYAGAAMGMAAVAALML